MELDFHSHLAGTSPHPPPGGIGGGDMGAGLSSPLTVTGTLSFVLTEAKWRNKTSNSQSEGSTPPPSTSLDGAMSQKNR